MFISFEGIEGSGKSTALEGLCAVLTQKSLAFTRTREPGGSALGKALRALLLDARNKLASEAELFLYLADRAQHVHEVIRPTLDAGGLVLSDRYADSTIVYQGFGRGLDVSTLFHLNETAVSGLWPDITLLFDLAPEEGLMRAQNRNLRMGTAISEGRFEAEDLAFHKRIREGYLSWAQRHPERFRIVDAAVPPGEVLAQTMAHLQGIF